jgi:hypothetical protein
MGGIKNREAKKKANNVFRWADRVIPSRRVVPHDSFKRPLHIASRTTLRAPPRIQIHR